MLHDFIGVQARSWHADDVVQTPHVAFQFFFFENFIGKKDHSTVKMLERKRL